ncbi:MAG: peptidylprolyl isomerase [Planctomycetes bacterium]|jgi:parvulin-like peptidyl-prolyl isomerase|nr:peptidylprolyl isomerase [Planctomycetota bacterium]
MARANRIPELLILASLLAPCAAAEEPPPAPPREAETFRPVVATVNGEILTEFDLAWNLGPVSKVLRGSPAEQQKQLEALRDRALRELVLTEIVVQEARRAGIKATDGMIRQKIQEESREAGGLASYSRLLREKGLSWAENWDRVRRDLYIEEYRHRLLLSRSRTRFLLRVPEIQVGPREVREYYRRHAGEFQEEVPGMFRMIRLDFDKFESRKAARDLAEEMLAKIREEKNPEARAAFFADLARKHSSDRNAREGGAWALKAEVELVPELHEQVLRLAPGEASEIVPQEYGLFLFLLVRASSKRNKPFEDVRDEIQTILRLERLQERWEEESRLLLRSARVWPEEIARALTKGQ